MRAAYYNEIDPFSAAWLRELIKAGKIAPGDVDERSITDVSADDVRDYTQAHFFAGIGGWSYALRLAGWGDGRPVWTGSCPCQGYSSAGKGKGAADARNLWPVWFRLISECRPGRVFGEQVANATGHGWLDAVSTDMEAADYAIGAAVLGAHSIGAPHIRQRLCFVAHTASVRCNELQSIGTSNSTPQNQRRLFQSEGGCSPGALDHAKHERTRRDTGSEGRAQSASSSDGENQGRGLLQALDSGLTGDLGDTNSARHAVGVGQCRDDGSQTKQTQRKAAVQASPWRDCDWLDCRDGKARPVEPGTFPLAHGVSARVGRLRGYGNAIVPQVAAQFIGAYLDCRPLSADEAGR